MVTYEVGKITVTGCYSKRKRRRAKIMGRKPRISLENRGKVLALSEEGYSQREVARRVGCCQRSVSDILKKERLTGGVRDRKIIGRKRKTTTKEDRLIVRKSKADRFKTATEIKAKMQVEHGVHISSSTTRRRLREAGLNGCKTRQKPRLTARHKRARLQFARLPKNWSARQWSRVIFSDESHFLIHRSDGRVYVRRMVGEALNENCVQATVQHGGGGIMVWGCISRKGMGILEKVNGRLDGNGYIYILENALVPTRDMLSMPRRWIFQQDNATCHTSKLVKQWFKDENITVMNWPVQSPDLNPIENMWDHLKRTVGEKNPKTTKELWKSVKDAWNKFPRERLLNLIDSMPNRCKAVIKARGGPTTY